MKMELSTTMDQTLVNIANNLSINYSMKQESMMLAKNEINQSLKTISDIFEELQNSYLYLLEDHQRLQSVIENSRSKNNNYNSKPNLCTTKEIINPNTIAMEFETPGIIENTQLELQSSKLKKRQSMKKQNVSTSPKKNSCNNENRMPKLNISKSSPIKSQLNHVGLSKSSVEVRILPSGKISRQSKLVVKPVETKTILTAPNKLENNNTEEKTRKASQIDDLNIDLTMFDLPFSQENDEIVEKSPNNLLKMKNLLCLSSKLSRSSQNSNQTDVQVIKQSNNDISKHILKKPLKKTGKKPQLGTLNLFVPKKSTVNLNESPILANESQILSLSDQLENKRVKNSDECNEKNVTASQETFFHADETYCSAGEIISPNVKIKTNNVNVNKRKFDDGAGPSNIPIIDLNLSPVPEDFGNVSDWDTDMSCEKWTSPKKRNLMDSFDKVPEKKKTSPTFAYKGPTIRQKAQRAKLRGWDCSDCEKYYTNLGLPEKEIEKRKNQCSRHRSKFNERNFTPPGFWNPNFPDTISSEEEMEH